MSFTPILPNFCCSSSLFILSFGDLNQYLFSFKTFETVVLLTSELKFSFIKFDNFRDDNQLSFSILLIIKLICSLSRFLRRLTSASIVLCEFSIGFIMIKNSSSFTFRPWHLSWLVYLAWSIKLRSLFE